MDHSLATVSAQTAAMPYRRRYPRRRRRYQFRYRRWRRPHRYWRRARKRYYHRRRVRPVYQYQPRKRTRLTVTGWEILGVIGSEITYTTQDTDPKWKIEVKDIAPANKQVYYFTKLIPIETQNTCTDKWYNKKNQMPSKNEKYECRYWDFVGGWGYAHFTLEGLVLRNLLGMNRFSTSIKGWTHIKYRGFKWQLVRGRSVDYLFRPEMHRGALDDERDLIHPAHLLNMPFVKWVESVRRTHCCKMMRIIRKPPPDLLGWHDLEDFRKLLLGAYQWTAFDPDNLMGKNPDPNKDDKDVWYNSEWMREKQDGSNIGINTTLKWGLRNEYDSQFVGAINAAKRNKNTNWWDWIFGNDDISTKKGKQTPFLPPIIPSEQPNTLWFRYKFFFQLGGSTISRNYQQWPIRETYDNSKTCQKNGDHCDYCIHPEDLDETGILKESALARITAVQTERRSMVEIIPKSILHRRKRKRITWWDEKKNTSTGDPDSDKEKNKYLWSMAKRLRQRLVRE
uniref:Capsid protein n=1 Tax=Giant panda anellovirus TaxID=2016460 RepID=A0A220IGJ9_9VIRU|nr:ORF1 [Giant panda anellovirus]